MNRVCRLACVAPLVLAPVVVSSWARAQTTRFEAASIKRNTSFDENSARNLGGGGRMTFVNVSLDRIIAAAYEIEEYQLLNTPGWAKSDRFDITATAGATMPLPQLNAMLRTLLAERFRLIVHAEERSLPSYVLSKARADDRLGAALKPSAAECGPTGRGSGTGPTPGCSAWLGPGTIGFAGQPISQLARALGMMLRQPVIDRTGLAGGYDFELKFSPEGLPGIPTGPPGSPGPPIDANSPTLFAALEEQLGLRLASLRAPAKVVVVDSVSAPTPD
jgi:uncharacterized protein (TIGR03435 family)